MFLGKGLAITIMRKKHPNNSPPPPPPDPPPVITPSPTNTSIPVVNGTANVSQTLTTTNGVWTNATSYTYQWLRGSTVIPGATSASYVVVTADIGFQLKSRVMAYNSTTPALAPVDSALTLTVTTPPVPVSAPVNTVLPAISGTAQQGQTLTGSTGTWSASAAPTYTYAWKSNGTTVGTSTTYTVVLGDVGHTITFTVVATNAGGSTTAVSNPTATVIAIAPVNTVAPAVTGTTTVGNTLSCSTGTWTNAVTYTYQWFRSGVAISGATSSTYLLVTADVSQTIKCQVTALNGTVASSPANSNTTAAISAANPPPPPTVQLWGVNLSGAEENSGFDGLNSNYGYPTNAQIDFWAAKGMKILRLPILMYRITNSPNNDYNIVKGLIDYANTKGMTVILDPHEYGFWQGQLIDGTANNFACQQFVAWWQARATDLLSRRNIYFGLMNEPYQQTVAQWWDAAKRATDAIHAIDSTRVCPVPGTFFTGGTHWVDSGNAAAALVRYPSPSDYIKFEMHQYLDSDLSGTHSTVVPGFGATCLTAPTAWLRANGRQGIIGELGFASDSASLTEGQAAISYIDNNKDVWHAFTWWSSSPVWLSNYMFEIDANVGAAQTAILVTAATN